MARLRRDRAESYYAPDNDGLPPGESEASPRANRRARRSPRKTQHTTNPPERGLDISAALPLSGLVPKHRPAASPKSKQIRLASMRCLNAPPLASSGRTESTSLASVRLPPPPGISTDSARRATLMRFATVEVAESDSEPGEVKETISSGWDVKSDGLEDELPSPRKVMLGHGREGAPEGIHDQVLATQTRHLRLAGPSEDSVASQPSHKVLAESRPDSSSDKEDQDRAILRFSPPHLYKAQGHQTPERPVTPPPLSPSKGRLLSPSKRAAKVPTPPHRPSIDTFWNANTVNAWNDQYSPRKQWSPRKLISRQVEESTSPTASPRKPQSPNKRTKAELAAKREWEARRHLLAESFLAELDTKVANGELANLAQATGGVRLIWSKTLNSTAGRANWRRETTKHRHTDGTTTLVHKHHASIELAEKVIDDEDRLVNVIAHEFCHLANFMISGVKDQPHGRSFKAWGAKCTRTFADRGVEVTTKHTYQIEYKYIWRCENELCGAEFKRHSKSINPKRHRCGQCREKLAQVKPVPRANNSTGGGYAAFVKANFASVKAELPSDATQKMIMEAVAKRYRAEKAAKEKVAADVAELSLSSSASELGQDSNIAVETIDLTSPDVDLVARKLEFVTLGD